MFLNKINQKTKKKNKYRIGFNYNWLILEKFNKFQTEMFMKQEPTKQIVFLAVQFKALQNKECYYLMY